MSFVDLEESKCIFGDKLNGRCNVSELKEYLVLLKGLGLKFVRCVAKKIGRMPIILPSVFPFFLES